MARITTNRNVTGSGPIRDPNASPRLETEGYSSAIAQQVINSPAYQSAFQVLSAESDKSWLQRLEMIPYSVDDAAQTFLDNVGLSSSFQDKQDANYQYCMEQISALMTEYQTWKNSLPVTQVQQMADAGINSSITGANIAGSSIPNVGVSSDPSQVRSVDPLSAAVNLGQFALNTVTGLASVIKSFKDLGISKRVVKYDGASKLISALIPFAEKYGIILPNMSDLDGIFDHIISSVGQSSVKSPLTQLKNYIYVAKETGNIAPIAKYLSDQGFDVPYLEDGVLAPSLSDTDFGISLNDSLSSIGKLQYDLWSNEMKHKVKLEKLNRDNLEIMSEEGVPAEIDSLVLDKENKEYEVNKLKILMDFINDKKSSSDSGNWVDTIIYMSALGIDMPDFSATLSKLGSTSLSKLLDFLK